MDTSFIIDQIDAEIKKLEQAKALLTGTPGIKHSPGRPSTNVTALVAKVAPRTTRKRISAEGRARIAAAQKARWAKAKKSTK